MKNVFSEQLRRAEAPDHERLASCGSSEPDPNVQRCAPPHAKQAATAGSKISVAYPDERFQKLWRYVSPFHKKCNLANQVVVCW